MKARWMRRLLPVPVCLAFLFPVAAGKESSAVRPLPIDEFVDLAARNDPVFEEILIDRLKLRYRKTLALPPRDLVAAVKAQYGLSPDGGGDGTAAAVSLTRLFPYTGTGVGGSYESRPSYGGGASTSEAELLVAQPIAENAFGRTTRLADRITGIENDLARHQIVEAYEDYLAALLSVYYDWYSAWENLKTGEAARRETAKLLDDMLARRRQRVALPVDVNKVRLLVLAKEEDLVSLRETYEALTNRIVQAVGCEGNAVPVDPSRYNGVAIAFDRDYGVFLRTGRTMRMLDLLERQRSLEVDRYADELLPSADLLLGYAASGDGWEMGGRTGRVFTGLSVELPLPGSVEKARYRTAGIERDKAELAARNKRRELYVDLKNLYVAMERERELISLADDRIRLAEAVRDAEAENYVYGRTSLNDYIDAVNRVDQSRFNRTAHVILRKKLQLEWLRLTDRLVDADVLREER